MWKSTACFSNTHEVAIEATKNMPSKMKRIDIVGFLKNRIHFSERSVSSLFCRRNVIMIMKYIPVI